MPMLSQFHLQSSGLLWVCHDVDTYIAPDQFHHWSAAWQPRLEPALQESARPLNLREGKALLVTAREDPR